MTFKIFTQYGKDAGKNNQYVIDAKILKSHPYEFETLTESWLKRMEDLFSYYENFFSVRIAKDYKDEKISLKEYKILQYRKKASDSLLIVNTDVNKTSYVPPSQNLKLSHYTSEHLLRLEKDIIPQIEKYLEQGLLELDQVKNSNHQKAGFVTAKTNYSSYLKSLQKKIVREKELLAEQMFDRLKCSFVKCDLKNGDNLSMHVNIQRPLIEPEDIKNFTQRYDLYPIYFVRFFRYIYGLKNSFVRLANQLNRLWKSKVSNSGGNLRLTKNNSLQAIPTGIKANDVPIELGSWGWFSKGTNALYHTFSSWETIVQEDLEYQRTVLNWEKRKNKPEILDILTLMEDGSWINNTKELNKKLLDSLENIKRTQQTLTSRYFANSRNILNQWQRLLQNKLNTLIKINIEYLENLRTGENLNSLINERQFYHKVNNLFDETLSTIKRLPNNEELQHRLENAKSKFLERYESSFALHFLKNFDESVLQPTWQQDEKQQFYFMTDKNIATKELNKYTGYLPEEIKKSFLKILQVLTGEVIITQRCDVGTKCYSIADWQNDIKTLSGKRNSKFKKILYNILNKSLHPNIQNSVLNLVDVELEKSKILTDRTDAHDRLLKLLITPEIHPLKDDNANDYFDITYTTGKVRLTKHHIEHYIKIIIYSEQHHLFSDGKSVFNAFKKYIEQYDGVQAIYSAFIYSYAAYTPGNGNMLINSYTEKRFNYLFSQRQFSLLFHEIQQQTDIKIQKILIEKFNTFLENIINDSSSYSLENLMNLYQEFKKQEYFTTNNKKLLAKQINLMRLKIINDKINNETISLDSFEQILNEWDESDIGFGGEDFLPILNTEIIEPALSDSSSWNEKIDYIIFHKFSTSDTPLQFYNIKWLQAMLQNKRFADSRRDTTYYPRNPDTASVVKFYGSTQAHVNKVIVVIQNVLHSREYVPLTNLKLISDFLTFFPFDIVDIPSEQIEELLQLYNKKHEEASDEFASIKLALKVDKLLTENEFEQAAAIIAPLYSAFQFTATSSEKPLIIKKLTKIAYTIEDKIKTGTVMEARKLWRLLPNVRIKISPEHDAVIERMSNADSTLKLQPKPPKSDLNYLKELVEEGIHQYVKTKEGMRYHGDGSYDLTYIHASKNIEAHRKRDIQKINDFFLFAEYNKSSAVELVAKIDTYLQNVHTGISVTGISFVSGKSELCYQVYSALAKWSNYYNNIVNNPSVNKILVATSTHSHASTLRQQGLLSDKLVNIQSETKELIGPTSTCAL